MVMDSGMLVSSGSSNLHSSWCKVGSGFEEFQLNITPINTLNTIKGAMANSLDPDQKASSDQGLHCLYHSLEF